MSRRDAYAIASDGLDLIQRCLDGHTETEVAHRVREIVRGSTDPFRDLELLILATAGSAAAIIEQMADGPDLLHAMATNSAVEQIFASPEAGA